MLCGRFIQAQLDLKPQRKKGRPDLSNVLVIQALTLRFRPISYDNKSTQPSTDLASAAASVPETDRQYFAQRLLNVAPVQAQQEKDGYEQAGPYHDQH